MRNRQLRRLGAALIALVLIFGAMTLTSRERSEVTLIEKVIATALYPLQTAADWVAGQFRGLGRSVQELVQLREENARMRQQVQDAAQHEALNRLLREENERLRGELLLKEQSDYRLLSAEVRSRNPDNWFHTVIINRGSRDGVQANMAVVNWQGLIGKVIHTTPFTATVQMVIDAGFGQSGSRAGFGAGAKLPSGETGVIETIQGGHVRMKFFNSAPAVQVGMPVFTSGQGVIPPNLLIGYVDAIGPSTSTLDTYAHIRPAVDFHKVDLLHVVMQTLDAERGEEQP
jgi:rod shape-determining protein MreC